MVGDIQATGACNDVYATNQGPRYTVDAIAATFPTSDSMGNLESQVRSQVTLAGGRSLLVIQYHLRKYYTD